MKRSEINKAIDEAIVFFEKHSFYLPEWSRWSPEVWAQKGNECDEIRNNALGWDITDFAKGDFLKEGLTLVTIRNGNPKSDKKTYCEKIMMVLVNQVTPIHFHWRKMEDIINRGGGKLCMKLWKANEKEELTQETCRVQIDGVTTVFPAGEVLRLAPGQSICFEPYMYHVFWAEEEPCMAGEVSTVNDDTNDNRFYEPLGRYPHIEEDVAANYLLCNEYSKMI
jgi:D-lyxose ketol-isomerase